MALEKNREKLVSVIVPIYNVDAWLEPCLDSIVGQTHKNLEILLVDDGSTDQSGAICDRYRKQDERVQVLHKENGGVSSARNAGIDLASGEYLIFVDADDFIHPELIELYMLNEGEGKNLLCDHVSDRTNWKESYLDRWEAEREYVERIDFMQLHYRDYMNSPVNKLYRTQDIKENNVRFPFGKSLGEDLIFNLQYYRYVRESYCLLHCPLYYYRENRTNSLSNSYYVDLFELQQELFSDIKKFLEKTEIWTDENAKIYYGMYLDRLYLAANACYAYEREHPEAGRFRNILRDPVWKQVRSACRERKLLNLKRRLKWANLNILRILR